MPQRLILVVGMHRSGTSAVTRALNLCGVPLPSDLLDPNFDNHDGFWEPKEVVRLHDELLASIGFSWDDIREFPREWFVSGDAARYRDLIWHAIGPDLAERGCLLVKDPRLCRLLPLWQRMARDQRVAIAFALPLRNPADVAASLGLRDRMPRDKALLLWLRHFLEAESATRGTCRHFIIYEQVMQDGPTTIAAAAQALGIASLPLPGNVELSISQALNPAHWHNRQSTAGLAGWLAQAYQWGLSAARGGTPDHTVLDTISNGLHAATTIYWPMIASRDEQIANLWQHTAYQDAMIQRIANEKRSLEEERRAMHEEQRVLQEERSSLIAARDAALGAYDSLFQSHQAALSELTQSERARDTLLRSTSWRVTAPLRWLASRALSGTKDQG